MLLLYVWCYMSYGCFSNITGRMNLCIIAPPPHRNPTNQAPPHAPLTTNHEHLAIKIPSHAHYPLAFTFFFHQYTQNHSSTHSQRTQAYHPYARQQNTSTMSLTHSPKYHPKSPWNYTSKQLHHAPTPTTVASLPHHTQHENSFSSNNPFRK